MIQEQMNRELREVEDNETLARQYLAENTVQNIEPLETLAETTEKMKALLPLANNAARLSDDIAQTANKQRLYESAVQFARTLPQTLLESVDCPIEGLGIDQNGEITINDLPIKNLSTSQQIKLSLEIAKVTSGAMKLICIDRFESLDSEMQKEFLAQMEGDGFQYFITQVTDGELTVSGIEKE